MANAFMDVLSRLKDPNNTYGLEAPRMNALTQAPEVAGNILQYQKAQRAAPIIAALQNYGKQWGAAQAPEEQQRINAAANLARSSYLKSGGSPMDLPENLWGSSPEQGFQTGAEEYSPSYTGDNMTLGQALKAAAATGMFRGQPTWDRQLQEAAESRETELFPLQKSLLQAQTANQQRLAAGGGLSGDDEPTSSEIKTTGKGAALDTVSRQLDQWWSELSDAQNATNKDWENAITKIENAQMAKIGEWSQYGLTYEDIFEAGDTVREMHGLPPKHRKAIVNSGEESSEAIVDKYAKNP
jgi:hypothetical protein